MSATEGKTLTISDFPQFQFMCVYDLQASRTKPFYNEKESKTNTRTLNFRLLWRNWLQGDTFLVITSVLIQIESCVRAIFKEHP